MSSGPRAAHTGIARPRPSGDYGSGPAVGPPADRRTRPRPRLGHCGKSAARIREGAHGGHRARSWRRRWAFHHVKEDGMLVGEIFLSAIWAVLVIGSMVVTAMILGGDDG